jgi:hypothetical protein
MTDITTAATIIQLAVPDLKLVLDPLLYLKAVPKPKGIPKVIHMTMRSKHSLAPHQILSIVSWGWYNRGYALLLYDNKDINAYMRRFYPAFVPSKFSRPGGCFYCVACGVVGTGLWGHAVAAAL